MNKYLLTAITLFLFSTHITVASDVKTKLNNLFNKKKNDQAFKKMSFNQKIAHLTKCPDHVAPMIADYLGYFKVVGGGFTCYDKHHECYRVQCDSTYFIIDGDNNRIQRTRIYHNDSLGIGTVSKLFRSYLDLQKYSITHDRLDFLDSVSVDAALKEKINTTKNTTHELRCIAGSQIVPGDSRTAATLSLDRSKLIVFDPRSEYDCQSELERSANLEFPFEGNLRQFDPRIFVYDIDYNSTNENSNNATKCSISFLRFFASF